MHLVVSMWKQARLNAIRKENRGVETQPSWGGIQPGFLSSQAEDSFHQVDPGFQYDWFRGILDQSWTLVVSAAKN